MSLALVTISESEFNEIFDHMISHPSGYRNLHLRQSSTIKGKRGLKYLHAMCALQGSLKQIEGMISGPKLFLHYQITRRANQNAQMIVFPRSSGDPRERDRVWKNFASKVLRRVRDERAARVREEQTNGADRYSRYTPGQYYLRRHKGSLSAATRSTCQQAIDSGVLDARFASQLEPWELLLFRGQ